MRKVIYLLGLFAVQANAATIETWILAGQSNAEGYAITENPVPGLAPADTLVSIGRSDLNVAHPNVRMYQMGTENWATTSKGMTTYPTETWHSMLPYEGLCFDWGSGLGRESGRRFGLELSFGFNAQQYVGGEIAILKQTRSSASLASGTNQNGDGYWNDYDPTDSRNNQYDKLIATITDAANALPAGDILRIQGFLWMQGEGDANNSYSSLYEANLTEFISVLRSDLASIETSTGGKIIPATVWSDTKFFIGKIAAGGTVPKVNAVRAAMDAVAAADANVWTVEAKDGMSFMSNDDWGLSGLHYDTAGQVLLGERFFSAVVNAGVVTGGAILSYNSTTFSESSNGSIGNSLTITLLEETFTTDVVSGGHVSAANVPPGLTAAFVRNSDTQITFSLTGNAAAHANVDDVNNLTVTFANAAFTGGDASNVVSSTRSDLIVDFVDSAITYSLDTFTESGADDGSMGNSLTLTLLGDTLTADAVSGGHVSAANVPAGLTASFVRDSSTQITFSLTGNATSHANADDINNLTVTFADAAFTGGNAAAVTDSVRNDLIVNFTIPALVGGTTLNGNFNAPGTAGDLVFNEVPYWVNIEGNQAILFLSDNPARQLTGHYAQLSEQWFTAPGLDTGHTLAEGDVFDVSYQWHDSEQWAGNQQVALRLFVTDNNLITGVETTLASVLSVKGDTDGNYALVSQPSAYTATAADAGKKLFIGLSLLGTSPSGDSYAQIDDVEVFVNVPLPDPYDAWVSDHEMTGGNETGTNDYDGDGIVNLLEYAIGGNPTNAMSTGTAPELKQSSEGAVIYIHTERATANHGLTYTLERADILTNSWSTVGDAILLGDGPVVGEFKTVTNQISTIGKISEYFRLRITK